MNLKKAKQLRAVARNASTPGEPLRELVQYKQECNPVFNKDTKKMELRSSVCAVNNPETFRGRYRAEKSGRTIDQKRIVRELSHPVKKFVTKFAPVGNDKPFMPKANQKNVFAEFKAKLARIFRHQSK